LLLNPINLNNRLFFGIKPMRTGASARELIKYIDTCALCGFEKIPKTERTFDHFLPTSKGGKTEFKNGLITCCFCNSILKTDMRPLEFFKAFPQTEKNLVRYLKHPEIKKIIIPKKRKNDSKQSYVKAFKNYAEQLLGRPLKD